MVGAVAVAVVGVTAVAGAVAGAGVGAGGGGGWRWRGRHIVSNNRWRRAAAECSATLSIASAACPGMSQLDGPYNGDCSML